MKTHFGGVPPKFRNSDKLVPKFFCTVAIQHRGLAKSGVAKVYHCSLLLWKAGKVPIHPGVSCTQAHDFILGYLILVCV